MRIPTIRQSFLYLLAFLLFHGPAWAAFPAIPGVVPMYLSPVGADYAAATKGGGNVGNGTIGTPTFSSTTRLGDYLFTFTSSTGGNVTFTPPGGSPSAMTPSTFTVGTLYNPTTGPNAGEISVLISAGSTAYASGDLWHVTMSACTSRTAPCASFKEQQLSVGASNGTVKGASANVVVVLMCSSGNSFPAGRDNGEATNSAQTGINQAGGWYIGSSGNASNYMRVMPDSSEYTCPNGLKPQFLPKSNNGLYIGDNYLIAGGFYCLNNSTSSAAGCVTNERIAATSITPSTPSQTHHVIIQGIECHGFSSSCVAFLFGDYFAVLYSHSDGCCFQNEAATSAYSFYSPVATTVDYGWPWPGHMVAIGNTAVGTGQFAVRTGADHSDGNCTLIPDDANGDQRAINPFTPKSQNALTGQWQNTTLLAGNRCLWNGGRGLHIYNGSNAIVAGNVVYGTAVDQYFLSDNLTTGAFTDIANTPGWGGYNVWYNNIGVVTNSAVFPFNVRNTKSSFWDCNVGYNTASPSQALFDGPPTTYTVGQHGNLTADPGLTAESQPQSQWILYDATNLTMDSVSGSPNVTIHGTVPEITQIGVWGFNATPMMFDTSGTGGPAPPLRAASYLSNIVPGGGGTSATATLVRADGVTTVAALQTVSGAQLTVVPFTTHAAVEAALKPSMPVSAGCRFAGQEYYGAMPVIWTGLSAGPTNEAPFQPFPPGINTGPWQ